MRPQFVSIFRCPEVPPRRMAVERMRSGTNIHEQAEELGVDRSLLYHWRGQLEATHADETAEQGQGGKIGGDAKLREENSVLAEKGLVYS